jgi:hypothetical protein
MKLTRAEQQVLAYEVRALEQEIAEAERHGEKVDWAEVRLTYDPLDDPSLVLPSP